MMPQEDKPIQTGRSSTLCITGNLRLCTRQKGRKETEKQCKQFFCRQSFRLLFTDYSIYLICLWARLIYVMTRSLRHPLSATIETRRRLAPKAMTIEKEYMLKSVQNYFLCLSETVKSVPMILWVLQFWFAKSEKQGKQKLWKFRSV